MTVLPIIRPVTKVWRGASMAIVVLTVALSPGCNLARGPGCSTTLRLLNDAAKEPLSEPYRVEMTGLGADVAGVEVTGGEEWGTQGDVVIRTTDPRGRTEQQREPVAMLLEREREGFGVVLVFTVPGTWHVRLEGTATGCVKEMDIEAVPRGG